MITDNICLFYGIDPHDSEAREALERQLSNRERVPEDLTHLRFSFQTNGSFGSQGSYLKATEGDTYYKLSYMSGLEVIGHESINECIVNELCAQFGFEYLKYDLHYATIDLDGHKVTTWLVSSKSYKEKYETRVTLEIFLSTRGVDTNNRKAVFEAILKLPEHLKQRIFEMCVVDYVIYNRDRHGANIELLEHNGTYRLAPIFDNGASLVAPLQNRVDAVSRFDSMVDSPVNNFIGSMLLSDMIRMVLSHYHVKRIKWDGKSISKYAECFENDVYITKINEIITTRLEALYEIQDSITRQ